MKKSRLVATATATALVMIAFETQAGIPRLTPGELALLPPFCQDVQTVNGWEQHVRESPRAPMWTSKMGRSFWDMHHYCWARTAAHRSKAAGLPPNQREYLIGTAVEDLEYVIRNAPPDMVMLPEIYYWMGEFQGQLKRYGEAYEAYRKSREFKSDYWPAYAGHADLLTLVGQRGEARAVLEQGLAIMPTEVALRSRLERLGPNAKSTAGTETGKKPKAAQDSSAATEAKPRSAAPAPR